MSNTKLREMINNCDQQVEDIDNSINQINSQLSELNEQYDAIRQMLDDITSDTTSYLEDIKIFEVNGSSITYDSDFGDSTVSSFHILDSTSNPIYEFEGIGWDDDTSIQTWIIQFDFSYDYLVHSLGITGTYGINDRINQLENAKDLLTLNKSKIENSKTVFEDYA